VHRHVRLPSVDADERNTPISHLPGDDDNASADTPQTIIDNPPPYVRHVSRETHANVVLSRVYPPSVDTSIPPNLPDDGGKSSAETPRTARENQPPCVPHQYWGNGLHNILLSRIHSLLIGIDEYRDPIPKLYGAVADMRSMEDYLASLAKSLAVPDLSRTVNVTLTNQEATRKDIIDAIDSLSSNDLICLNDAILIYFAGHGCSTDGKEAIIPCDAPKADGNFANLISHLKFGSLLRNLADKK
jgi:hypothetical protein